MSEPQTHSPNTRELQYWNSAATRALAEDYEWIDRLFAGVTQAALDAAAPQSGERVIDIGCGSGSTILALADVSTHGFAPDSFDLAFSRFGVMFFADPTESFANLHKGMKSGGRVVFAVFRSRKENPWATAPIAALGDLLPPQPKPGPEDPGQFSWADPARVHRILEGAGFRDVTLTRTTQTSALPEAAAPRKHPNSPCMSVQRCAPH